MVNYLLDAATRQIFFEILKYIGILLAVIFGIFLTLKIKYLSHIIGILFAVGMSIGYKFRSKLFPFVFNINTYEELEGFKEVMFLGIFIAVFTYLWIIYVNSAGAIKEDDEGWYFLVWGKDGTSREWSVFGRMAFIGLIISAVVGFGVAWLNCYIWSGCVYVLTAIQGIIGLICMIGSIKVSLDY